MIATENIRSYFNYWVEQHEFVNIKNSHTNGNTSYTNINQHAQKSLNTHAE